MAVYDSMFMFAANVQKGDNVWEHNIVDTIEQNELGDLVFNGKWSAHPADTVMVTNRDTKDAPLESIKSQVRGYILRLNQKYNDGKYGYSVEWGRRYAKISRGNRVHTFVDLRNADLLKAATFRAPAKNGVRGSLWSRDFGMSAVNEFGANYLK